MLKKEDKIHKISNIFFIVIIVLSLLSIISLLFTGYKNVENRTQSDFYLNLIILSVYMIVSLFILYISNYKINFYKKEYSMSKKIYNLFVLISCLSICMMITSVILGYLFLKTFSWYSLLIITFGYIPIYIISYIGVNKNKLFENSKKENIMNFIIVILLMNYSLNIISLMLQMLFNIGDITLLISDICISFIWIFIILIAHKLLNKKA